jgi:chloramphenicol 3-O-phosphotransferase
MSIVTLDRQTHALESAYLYDKERPADESSARAWPMCVALSREAGTPVAAVAAEVGRQLGWPVHDDDILQRVAHDLGINVRALSGFDERRQSWLVECIEAFSSRPSVGEFVYVRHLVRVLRSLASQGRCVIVGRGAAQVLPSESTLRVLLVGAQRDRCGLLAQRLGLDNASAARMLDEIESERAGFIKEHFNRDPRDVGNYDLVVNTSHLPPADCAAVIVEALHHREPAAKPK